MVNLWRSPVVRKTILAALLFNAFGCGGGGGDGVSSPRAAGSGSANFDCDGTCPNERLEVAEVEQILRQGVAGAQQLGIAATFAVTDRVGNVLAVYVMPGALGSTTINGQIGAVGGLEGATVPAVLAAISKAGTAAYLSSQGNSFSTRTASQIVQENFNPGEGSQPGGPLFGVQFSQLPCSDVVSLSGGLTGPRPLPLGLSADPGAIPLYQNGDLVGGVGVELDGLYTLDRVVTDRDDAPEERLALTASLGFEFPSERSGDQIFVAGKSLRTADLDYSNLETLPPQLPALEPSGLVAVPPFFSGVIRDGAAFGTAESGVLKIPFRDSIGAILVDGSGNQRFPARAGTPLAGGIELKPFEVQALLESAFVTATRARAAIRRPLDTQAHVSIWIVDTKGEVLGMVRTADAPVFGLDVALQKARGSAFFSSPDAADRILEFQLATGSDDYLSRAQLFLGPTALRDGRAFGDRAVGNLSRPFFPDGVNDTGPGPFSLPFPGTSDAPRSWSPFNTGFQLDLIIQAVIAPLAGTIPDSCSDRAIFGNRIRNGIQIFPGSVPLYRGTTLLGAIGISGDGIDQDDLVAFYGASRTGLDIAGHPGVGDPVLGFNAPPEIRADFTPTLVENIRLRYVNCPESPFRGSDEQRVCGGDI